MEEKNKNIQKKLSVSIDPEINSILENAGFNKSKLINKLLSDYLNKQKLNK